VRPVDGVQTVVAPPKSSSTASQEDPAKASTNAVVSQAAPVPKAELTRQVQALQSKMDRLNPALAFVVDQDSGKAVIQLTDRATKEVIQQFPTEAALHISKALDRFQKGQLIDLTV